MGLPFPQGLSQTTLRCVCVDKGGMRWAIIRRYIYILWKLPAKVFFERTLPRL
jgi:hypothetical protein